MELSNVSGVQLSIKYKGSKPANKWIIGFREDNPNTIEVWVGDAMGASECQPSYRLWSTVSHEYASPH
ncbi:MAG: hypothetical protein IJM44_08270, partial [Ruminococcus sp.]|nr:hypothetical protein [Ruminococcus sp.]